MGGLHLRSVAVVLRFLQLTGDLVLGFVPGVRHGDGGWMVAGYTAQFGNGFSGTIAAEMRRNDADQSAPRSGPAPGFVSGRYGGFQAPDLVANLRVDQAWGSAQIMGALHQVNATYYEGGIQLPMAIRRTNGVSPSVPASS